MMSDFAIELENVWVRYRSYQNRPTSLKESIVQLIKTGRISYYSTFDALSAISFAVEKGSVLGIIGSNGAGKSTLLRVISGVLPPTSGKVSVQGRIDSLIKLGAGFDNELTARENISLYSSLHGKSKVQIQKSVDRILEFAELEDFEHTPIKYFSSGMAARLGFSCAIDIDPDILLVDEVLAVGDERFSAKCRLVFKDLLSKGKTVVMVSHAVDELAKQANKILVLAKGRALFCGDSNKALSIYRDPSYQTRLPTHPV